MSEKEQNDSDKMKKPGSENSERNIQYVPINLPTSEYHEEDDVDLTEVIRMFWDRRKLIYKVTLAFLAIGLIVAVFSPVEYTSDVKLLPEEQEGFSLGALGGLAQQFGFGTNTSSSSEDISANLYPSIIQSNVFLEELMRYEVRLAESEKTLPLRDYVKEYQKSTLLNSILHYTILLPFTVNDWLQSEENEAETVSEIDWVLGDRKKISRLTNLSKGEWITLRNIRNRIQTDMEDETGIVSVDVTLQDPVIAAAVADEVVRMLSEYITEKRTEKARRDFKFIQERFEEARLRFEQAQIELAEFNDENRGQLTALAQTEQQLLQSRYELNFNLYNSMAERLEESRIRLQEETPVINILEPAAVPDQKSEPKRLLILVVFSVVGVIIGMGIIIMQPFWEQLKSGIKKV